MAPRVRCSSSPSSSHSSFLLRGRGKIATRVRREQRLVPAGRDSSCARVRVRGLLHRVALDCRRARCRGWRRPSPCREMYEVKGLGLKV